MNSKEKHQKYFNEYRKHVKKNCEACGSTSLYDKDGFLVRRMFLTVHHIDGEVAHNDPTNLMTLCRNCHDKVHGFDDDAPRERSPRKKSYSYKPKGGKRMRLQPPLEIWRAGVRYLLYRVE